MAGNAANAGKLVAVMSKKAKPEGMSDADWTAKKDAYLGAGYFYGGASACTGQRWAECERNMKAAEPLVKGGQLGSAYFYLGLADYQLGTLTQDRTKLQASAEPQPASHMRRLPVPIRGKPARTSLRCRSNSAAAPRSDNPSEFKLKFRKVRPGRNNCFRSGQFSLYWPIKSCNA